MSTPVIKVEETNDNLTSHSGLDMVGTMLNALVLKQRLDLYGTQHYRSTSYLPSDILFSMIGLISIGKPDYDAIELFRESPDFFLMSMGIRACPSAATLRQQIDSLAHDDIEPILKEESAQMIKRMAPQLTPVQTCCGDFLPLDIDVSPFDNSKTQKEGVSRTYKGHDGYSPIFGYLGTEGFLLNLQLRAGSQHCQKDTPAFIAECIRLARQITVAPILMRLDSGNDCKDNFPNVESDDVHFIIKRNLRNESPKDWLNMAQKQGRVIPSRDGKTIWIGQTTVGLNGQPLPYPISFKVTERTIDKNGQYLVVPEVEAETYWCDLKEMPADEVIRLYHGHGTSEQFHSELKTDLNLERLPSGRFSSNSIILHLAMLSFNALRIIGQLSLEEACAHGIKLPGGRSKKVQRRRIKTVMQDLIYMAGRLTFKARQWFIGFGRLSPFAKLWELISLRIRVAAS